MELNPKCGAKRAFKNWFFGQRATSVASRGWAKSNICGIKRLLTLVLLLFAIFVLIIVFGTMEHEEGASDGYDLL